MPSETDLYFPMGDFQYESRFMRSVKRVPIPSILGHLVGSPADRTFINTEIQRFLE